MGGTKRFIFLAAELASLVAATFGWLVLFERFCRYWVAQTVLAASDKPLGSVIVNYANGNFYEKML